MVLVHQYTITLSFSGSSCPVRLIPGLLLHTTMPSGNKESDVIRLSDSQDMLLECVWITDWHITIHVHTAQTYQQSLPQVRLTDKDGHLASFEG